MHISELTLVITVFAVITAFTVMGLGLTVAWANNRHLRDGLVVMNDANLTQQQTIKLQLEALQLQAENIELLEVARREDHAVMAMLVGAEDTPVQESVDAHFDNHIAHDGGGVKPVSLTPYSEAMHRNGVKVAEDDPIFGL